MAQATASTRAFGTAALDSAAKNKAAFTTVGIAALALGGGIAFGLKRAADAAIEFESSFAGVRKTVDATEPEFQQLADGMRQLATEIPISVHELNRIGEAAGQLGIEKENILSFTRVMADLGVTTNLASDEAATSLARLANITQMPQSQFSQLGSAVVDLGNNFATTEAEIVEMSLRIAGAGHTIGMSESDILGFSAALSSVGIEAQMGGSAISRVMVSIAQEVENGGDKLETFAKVAGMSSSEFAQAFESDAAGAITSFVAGLGKVQDAGGNVFGILQKLGFSEIRVRDALLRSAGAGELLADAIGLSSDAWDENNALTKEAEERYGTTASQIQIAKNRINDAAIAFGQVMLPAIGAVAQAVGGLADVFADLPGPVKGLVVILGALGAGMLIIAGGALLLVPRLAAVKTAMAEAGISAGFFRGSLALAARAINPWTIALTAATIGLTIWAQKKAESKARVEEFTRAIEADSGALGANTRALAANRLEQEDALQAAQNLGISMETVTDAALGVPGAYEEVAAAIARVRDESNRGFDEDGEVDEAAVRAYASAGVLADALGIVTDEVDAGQVAAERLAEATGDEAEGHEKAGDAAKGQGEAVGELGEDLEEAASLAEQLTQALEDLAGISINAEKASLAYKDSIAEMRKELRKGTKTLNDSTQAGRDNRQSILNAVDAAIDHGAAVADETGSLKKGAQATAAHVRQIIREAEQAGIAKGEIRDYIRELNLTPSQIRTTIKAVIAQAQGDVERYNREIRLVPRTVVTNFIAKGRIPRGVGGTVAFHGGGTVGESGPRRLHSGGGVRGDEELIVAQRGERVLSSSQWRALRSITGAGAMRRPSIVSNPKHRDVRVAVRLGRRRFTDEMDYDTTYDGRWA